MYIRFEVRLAVTQDVSLVLKPSLGILACSTCYTTGNWLRKETYEQRMHRKAAKTGLSLGARVDYVDLPMITDYKEDGSPVVELCRWPFILPRSFVLWRVLKLKPSSE